MNAIEATPIEILLVEDNPGDVDLTIATLRNCKILNSLTVARDGVEAMDLLHRKGEYADAPRPDIILLDLNLPKKSGHEVLAEVKQDPELRRIPVVVITSSMAEEDVLKAYDLHANCFVTKPVDLEQFKTVVQSIENFWFSLVKLPFLRRLSEKPLGKPGEARPRQNAVWLEAVQPGLGPCFGSIQPPKRQSSSSLYARGEPPAPKGAGGPVAAAIAARCLSRLAGMPILNIAPAGTLAR